MMRDDLALIAFSAPLIAVGLVALAMFLASAVGAL